MKEKINFKKKFGQNFLSDSNLLKAIVEDSKIDDNSLVVEVGAGAGALTEKLCQKANRVLSFEIDEELEPILRDLEKKNANLKVFFQDFMKISQQQLKQLAGENFDVVANLPYYITSPLITKFLSCRCAKSLTVMVQEEVAQRIVAKPKTKDYGVLSIMVGLCGDATITRKVNRKMFTPVPNVDSAVVHIDITKIPSNYEQIVDFVKLCFASRRKTLQNNLSKTYSKQEILEVFDRLQIPLNSRAEDLFPYQFSELCDYFSKSDKKQ